MTSALDYEREFETEFWPHYPLKRDKRNARIAYIKARMRGVPKDAIINGTLRYAAECIGRDPHTIKYAQGWISGERWEDEPMPDYRPALGANGKPRGYAIDDAGFHDGPTEPAPKIEGWETPMGRPH
jgi:hypothetical protein